MITKMLASAPAAWVPGSGSADVRPLACAAARPSLLPPVGGVQGTGVPFAGMERRRGADLAGIGFPAGLPTPLQHDPITQNDGTTPLGIHSPGRPKS